MFVMVAAFAGPALSPASASTKVASTKVHHKVAKPAVAARPLKVVLRHPLMHFEPAHPSFGQLAGLHAGGDPLELKSAVALVLDQDTNEVLFSKNSAAVLPIASLSKLMTAMIVTQARQPLEETLTVTQDDVDTEKHSSSRLAVGTQLTRGEMLHLALMASENRAAHAMGRNYPGGLDAFVAAMNAKAHELGMADTHYVEPTGLSSHNQSSAHDLAILVNAAHKVELLRELTTSPEYKVAIGNRQVQFHTTNSLVRNPSWDIGLQKTGYITEAGRCMVMQAQVAGRKLIMVLLDSAGTYSRVADAERIRRWITAHHSMASVPAGLPAVLPGVIPVISPAAVPVPTVVTGVPKIS